MNPPSSKLSRSATIRRKLAPARRLLADDRFFQAFIALKKLSRLHPKSPEVWLEYAAAATAVRDADTAEFARRQVRALASRDAGLLLQLGHQYRVLRQPERARDCFARAAAADPRNIDALISLAGVLERSHELAAARDCVERCLAVDPGDEQAAYFSALLDRRENRLEAAERRLRDLIASDPRHPYVRYSSRYELAQILDRTGRPDEAMAQLARAKALVRRLADIKEITRVYDAEMARARQAENHPTTLLREWADSFPEDERAPTPRVAFLGGHPRSGTTLMEQILGAHPKIAALDEPPLFSTVLMPGVRQSQPLIPARLNVLRQNYTAALARSFGAGAGGRLLLEKNPSLTSALPLWLRIFPDLRVIIALRDPRDVILSCYFQNLPLNVTNANFLSLERAARHYSGLMDVWLAVRRWDGLTAIETRYEDTVADARKEGGRVTEFLGLRWRREQASFHRQERHVFSPSYHDVSRPIHARSVARWRAYEHYLAPVMPILKPYLRAFGYR